MTATKLTLALCCCCFASVALAEPQNCVANPDQPFCSGTPGPQGPQGETGPQGPQGSQGEPGKDGQNGKDGAAGQQGVQGDPGQNGADGQNGTNGKDGRNGFDFNAGQALAVAGALSLPVWLGDRETVRISGGLGFAEGGDTALGATGVVRIDKNWAAFAGGAVALEGNAWAGHVGASVGW